MFKDLYIKTPRLVLRPFSMDDLPAFHALVNQPEVMEFLPENVMTLEEAEKILAWLIESYRVNTRDRIRKLTVAVSSQESGHVIGWSGLGPLEFDLRNTELFYGISHSDWGRGFATEAARAIIRFGFGTIGLDEIVAVVSPENRASRRVIEKLDMTYRDEVRGLPPEHRFYEGSLLYSLRYREWNPGTA